MVASISSEALSEIIDAIYASATNPALWTAALRRINEATECRASVVGIVSFEEDFSLVNATAGFDEGFARRYGSNLPALSEIWGGDRQIAARPMHEPVVLSLHHPQALVRGTPQHDLLCEVLGFEVADTLNLPMKHLGRAIGASGFARAAGEGCFEPELYRLFRLLSPISSEARTSTACSTPRRFRPRFGTACSSICARRSRSSTGGCGWSRPTARRVQRWAEVTSAFRATWRRPSPRSSPAEARTGALPRQGRAGIFRMSSTSWRSTISPDRLWRDTQRSCSRRRGRSIPRRSPRLPSVAG